MPKMTKPTKPEYQFKPFFYVTHHLGLRFKQQFSKKANNIKYNRIYSTRIVLIRRIIN